MKKRLTALGYYVLFWLLFFLFARLFFILTHHREAFKYGVEALAGTFLHGIKLDISATAYVFVFAILALIPAIWLHGNWYRILMRSYTYVLIFVASMIIVGDTILYIYWGFRMDYTPLFYLKTPREAAASLSTFMLLFFILTVLSMTAIFIILYNKFIDSLFCGFNRIRFKIPVTLFFLLLAGTLIIPFRGGVGLAPINAGSVYFSEHMFLNHAAINVVWNVGNSIYNNEKTSNPYTYTDTDMAGSVVDSLTFKSQITPKILNKQRPNLLLIILESFGNSMIGPLGGDSLTTPSLNKIIDDGILFTNFYASGNRTDKALPAILNGYPAQPATSIIKVPRKTQSLPSLVKILDSMKYNNSFWYGGDINFANFNSFVIASGFRKIITMHNFSPEYYNSKWGVHDHVLFDALKDSMRTVKEPFFNVVLTLSSHEPFEVPVDPVFKGKDIFTKYRNSIYYTDHAVGEFLEWAKNSDWWENTLVILVADHCRRNSQEIPVYSQDIFKIPMLWLGGALDTVGIRIDKIGSQIDIPCMICNQLGLRCNFPFSKDLLSNQSVQFAFYTFNEGFAFINENSVLIYDHKLGKPLHNEGMNPGLAEKSGKAFLQVLYDDYLER